MGEKDRQSGPRHRERSVGHPTDAERADPIRREALDPQARGQHNPDQRAEQVEATLAAHGRLLRHLQQQGQLQDPVGVKAYVCGIGTVPAAVLLAAADLEDARAAANKNPGDLAATAALRSASTALAAALVASGATGSP